MFNSLRVIVVILSVSRAVNKKEKGLFLTDYLKEGKVTEGREAARVNPLAGNVTSYAGYLTVSDRYGSNLFFVYFPNEDVKAAVVLWLQGGPGSSSLYGLFFETGPWRVDGDRTVLREHSWLQASHLVYVDNPVGTGFSFTRDPRGYCSSQTDVAAHLYSFTLQLLELFPELSKNELYIVGESYGGKYACALAHAIHENGPRPGAPFVNLKGLALGNAFLDPVNMLDYGDYLFQVGLIDRPSRAAFDKQQKVIKHSILEHRYLDALWSFERLILGFKSPLTLYFNATHFDSFYNILTSKNYLKRKELTDFIKRSNISKSFHVGDRNFNEGHQVKLNMLSDIMKSVAPWLSVLLNNYRVIIYTGQLDVIVAYPLTESCVRRLQWKGAEAFRKAPRRPWFVRGELAGYSKTAKVLYSNGSLVELMVRNAGHLVPCDQPLWALDIVSKLVQNIDF